MQHLGRRVECKNTALSFRDDLSEYSSPSSWGDFGPLSVCDHCLAFDGLQARRTAGEALLRAEWERKCEEEAKACNDACKACSPCIAFHVGSQRVSFSVNPPRLSITALRQPAPSKPSVVFTWAEVQSLLLLPHEERGPYLIALSTERAREDGSREWLLQAGSLRARSRWAVDITTALLKERKASEAKAERFKSGCVAGRPTCRVSNLLFTDLVRIACEAARMQPSPDCMGRIMEALDLLCEVPVTADAGAIFFSMAPLQRFRDATSRAREDFFSWQRWREVALVLRSPPGLDEHVWRTHVLPFLAPQDPSLRCTDTAEYPAALDGQLVNASERCRRTLS